MSAYCKLGKIDKGSDLVAWMKTNQLGFDVVFYSNWIYGCFREGLFHDALGKFRVMANNKVDLDTISYSILIDGFSKDGNVEKAVGFLHKMIRDGLEPNLITYTAIILGFCKKGKLQEAFAIFGMLKRLGIQADEFTYAILIDGVCREGDFDKVFKLLDEMGMKGINIGVVTYNTVINGLSKAGRMSEADDFSKGINGDVITYCTLLQGYTKEENSSGILETKNRLEKAGIRMDIILCNILIKALLMVGLYEDAIEIYKGLPEMDFSANSITYCTLIDGFCKVSRFDEALEIFDEFRNKLPSSSTTYYGRIVRSFCGNGMVDEALNLFIEYLKNDLPFDRKMCMMLIKAILKEKGGEGILKMVDRLEEIEFSLLDFICNNAIGFICNMGFPEASYSLLLTMRRKGLPLGSFCYYTILRTLISEGKRLFAQLILTSFLKLYGISDLRVCKIIANYLCLHDVKKVIVFLSTMNEKKSSIIIPVDSFKKLINNNRISDAYGLLIGTENELPGMSVFHYTIVINALCKARKIDKALDLCTLAKKKGIDLNIVTYNTVINGLCMQGCLIEAFRLFDSLERINLLPTEVTYGMLIDALVREGLIRDAKMLFERMFEKNLRPGLRIYNSLINGYSHASLLEEAIKLFQDLEMKNLEADGFTISSLINGYCQKGDMEGALNFFFELKNRGLSPDFLGFLYLMRGLCSKGRMEESRSILREMLHTQSAVDLLNTVKTEDESDSVEKIVDLLCERGLIVEAVDVLNEVGSVIFPVSRNYSRQALSLDELESNTEVITPSVTGGSDFLPGSSDVEKVENMLQICASEDVRTRQLKDFDSFYSAVRSLCMKGELAEANRLTKLLMEL